MTAPYEPEVLEFNETLAPPYDPTTPEGEAIQWWMRRASAHQYVGRREELPSPEARRVLRNRGLIAEPASNWGFVVKAPHTDAEVALQRNGWGLVAATLEIYAPAAVDRISVVKLMVGEETLPEEIFVRHGANKSVRSTSITRNHRIILRPDSEFFSVSPPDITTITVGSSPPVALSGVGPATLLTSLTLGDIKHHIDTIAAWLRTLVMGRVALARAYQQQIRPVLLSRIGMIARDVGNTRLASTIEEVITANTRTVISRSNTGVGTAIIIPRYITRESPAASPWLERNRVRFERARDQLALLFASLEQQLPRFSPSQIISIARSAKLDDTYHSTTIEGYRITRDEVRAVVEGRLYDGKTPEETQRLMALQGYARAFDWVLTTLRQDRQSSAPVTDAFVFDLFLELWSPSIDAGVVDAPSLRAWRSQQVQIHRSIHVPPGPEKLGGLMTQFLGQLNDPGLSPLTRATLGHWMFVHLHPFKDGNGRTARLLMNYLLGSAGLPWTTIRVEDRARYFAALEAAHVREDLEPFGRFIGGEVERAAREYA